MKTTQLSSFIKSKNSEYDQDQLISAIVAYLPMEYADKNEIPEEVLEKAYSDFQKEFTIPFFLQLRADKFALTADLMEKDSKIAYARRLYKEQRDALQVLKAEVTRLESSLVRARELWLAQADAIDEFYKIHQRLMKGKLKDEDSHNF